MSAGSKHRYRFVFLRSEKWKNVRIEALANQKAKCKICGFESISNDAHHIYYPPSVWDTDPSDLVILCRPCHELVHAVLNIQHNRKTQKSSAMMDLKSLAIALGAWRELCDLWNREKVKKTKLKILSKKSSSCRICLSSEKPLQILDVGKIIGHRRHVPVLYFTCEECSEMVKKRFVDPNEFKGMGRWKVLKDWIYDVRLKKKILDYQ